ncbi:hypothetical protein M427DRAFT_152754 [Gonapodya prolifera JEL478]|uniref:Ankyrin n=1 Tax=Gonapodya prolifera (strain JEL478) TaxID=1344416 RepID=A0A139ARA9_GONPJ|nr:hypothetical protein M427DRAFT_152754 [Gonapodya prolifera JEL478]|eukprot:KXS19287.1 hypothetical protein M427DRAFT_152754 [Gonapodya prolifera JEL478]
MADDPNSKLIDGLENGDLELVENALQAGADPNVCKRVSLCVRLGTLRRTDTEMGEPAIVLAILSTRGDVVRCLIEAGCDINRPIEWRVAQFWESWTQAEWERDRWCEQQSTFATALDFALSAGTWEFSLHGSHVVLNQPSSAEQVSNVFYLTPTLEIVRLLLQSGAHVSNRTYELARDLKVGKDSFGQECTPMPEILELLEAHTMHALRTPSPVSTRLNGTAQTLQNEYSVAKLTAALSEQQRISAEQARANAEQREQIAELLHQMGQLQQTSESLQKTIHSQVLCRQLDYIKELVAKTAVLEVDLRHRSDRVAELESLNLELSGKVAELEISLEHQQQSNARHMVLSSTARASLSPVELIREMGEASETLSATSPRRIIRGSPEPSFHRGRSPRAVAKSPIPTIRLPEVPSSDGPSHSYTRRDTLSSTYESRDSSQFFSFDANHGQILRSPSHGPSPSKRPLRPRIPRIRREPTFDSTSVLEADTKSRATDVHPEEEEWVIAFTMTYGFWPTSQIKHASPPQPKLEIACGRSRRTSGPLVRSMTANANQSLPSPPPTEPPTPERANSLVTGE